MPHAPCPFRSGRPEGQMDLLHRRTVGHGRLPRNVHYIIHDTVFYGPRKPSPSLPGGFAFCPVQLVAKPAGLPAASGHDRRLAGVCTGASPFPAGRSEEGMGGLDADGHARRTGTEAAAGSGHGPHGSTEGREQDRAEKGARIPHSAQGRNGMGGSGSAHPRRREPARSRLPEYSPDTAGTLPRPCREYPPEVPPGRQTGGASIRKGCRRSCTGSRF